MTDAEKLSMVKALIPISDTSYDATLSVYLSFAKQEILSWLYSMVGGIPSDVTDVPRVWETTQIMACVAGFEQAGATGQTGHGENGITRTWSYPTMVDYIRTHVTPYAGVVMERPDESDGDGS